ncbi:Disease resistance protein (CC-NBS-LRR class) family [Euphorbia peplus]|nr:Disease resistance protein (CC-NBS-LRR class) family [Euphorbia peplus]
MVDMADDSGLDPKETIEFLRSGIYAKICKFIVPKADLKYRNMETYHQYASETATGFIFPEDVHKQVRGAHFPATIEQHQSRKRVPTSTDLQSRRKRTQDTVATATTRGVYLPATEKIVGTEFVRCTNVIWSWLMFDEVCQVGIHGIGGVGKTEVTKHVNNKLLQIANKFQYVFWVKVSPRTSVRRLQNSISKAVGVNLSDEYDESIRATQLTIGLAEKKKFLLILDDLWDYIPLQEIGIPVGVDGSAVLFATRSLEVCRQFGCQRTIEITSLPEDECYELFKIHLGMERTLPTEVEAISKLVANKCVGLPLAITIMARKMKGVTDIGEWTRALEGHTQKEVYEEIFQKLKVSYDYLKDTTLQNCFLHCPSLFQEYTERYSNYWVVKRRLLEYLVDKGIVKRRSTRREELAGALTLLNFLCDAGLLEMSSCSVRMNALIRNMALQIMEENKQVMIMNDMSLREVPNEESWTRDLLRVSLEGNQFKNIPSGFSASCSKLSTLLLSRNSELEEIGDTFFSGMPGLQVLDLAFTSITSLPSSIDSLVNLTTLVLSGCKNLKVFPSVALLRALKKLDLSYSGVEGSAKDIHKLSKLGYLDLFLTRVKLEPEELAKHSRLQVLKLPWTLADKGDELARLSRLESLTCCFSNVVELNKYLGHLKCGFKEREPPIAIDATVGSEYYTEFINVVHCHEPKTLSSFSPITGASELKYISIRECDGLEFLCLLSLPGQRILEKLEYMELFNLDKLSMLFKTQGNINAAYGSCFSNLTRFSIQGCLDIQRLFPIGLWKNLKNLERLYVTDCISLEEIFAAEEEEEVGSLAKLQGKITCSLPKLRIMRNCPRYLSRPKWSTNEGFWDEY